MAVEIKYNDTTIANVEAGKTATLTCKDKKMKTDIIIAAPIIEDSATPVEVATEDEMATLLETAEVGAIYKYTGETTDAYENGVLYMVEEEDVTDATVTITNTSASYVANVGTSVVFGATDDIGTVDTNSTETFTIPIGTEIYISAPEGGIPAWSLESITGDCEDTTTGHTASYIIKGDCTIIGYAWDAD